MSKIGQANLALQEQAEELGFESVQEALDNGYTVAYIENHGMTLMADVMTKLHEEWLAKRETIIAKLEMLIADTPYQVYKDTLRETIDFIKEGEI